jgi:DNA polymerase III alpha subunit
VSRKMFDIDIDMPQTFDPKDLFPWTRAAVVRDGQYTQHPCGVYPQTIPVDPVSGLAAIPYDAAEELGYFKIDFLHLNVYQHFKTRAEIDELLLKEPDWTLLQVPSNHMKLFQLANHGELLMKLRPSNIVEMSDVMALIRPGKRQLVPLYQKSKDMARPILWKKDETGYSFKKSHALSYAYVLILQLHLIEQGRL